MMYINSFLTELSKKIDTVGEQLKDFESKMDKINNVKDNCENIIKPDEGFGAVKYIEATLNDEVMGAIVFPAKSEHTENYLEFIAENKLRDDLNLKDGDIVSIEF